MPRVIRRVFWRILIFYVLTIIIIGFDIPYNYPNLSTRSTATSPFTIVFTMVGSKVAGSFMNTGEPCYLLIKKALLLMTAFQSSSHRSSVQEITPFSLVPVFYTV
jgi:hypothetical protein